MKYEMEELVPIVGKLAEKYTAYESTSITYEKAEQLMGAILYCIHELEETRCDSLISNEKMPAYRVYEMGVACIEEKTKDALKLYNKILPEFCHYENQCLYDVFVKGLPEFFKWYDIRFEPQNTILALDYPVLKDISEDKGIDRIYEFIKCICLEQKFLKLFPVKYVTDILSEHATYWKESMDNICETVFTCVIGHILVGKPVTEFNLDEEDYSYMQELLMHSELENIKKQIKNAVEAVVKNYYENDGELLDYLSGAVGGIVIRLKNAAENHALRNIL